MKDVKAPDAATGSAEKSATEVEDIGEGVASEAGEIIYSRRFALKRYEVTAAGPETMETWKGEIAEIKASLEAGKDSGQMDAIVEKRDQKLSQMEGVWKMLNEEELDDEALTLLSVGLWAEMNAAKWQGISRAAIKLLKGGRRPLAETVAPDDVMTCLDRGVLINEIMKAHGIPGGVYTFGKTRFGHRFWISDSGRVLDPGYAWSRGGYCPDLDHYREHVKNNKALARRDRMQHSFPVVKEF